MTRRKMNTIFLLIIMVLITSFSVGYSALSQNLMISGDALYSSKILYQIIASKSVLDDRASTYVTSSTGINFGAISSDTNGKGIYEIASTKNDTYPIYYYRGAVDNNNVKFGGFCWKIIRTTNTGGVKLIYNGSPDETGNCTSTTGTDTQIGTSRFNYPSSPAYAGYMYGTRYTHSSKTSSNLNTSYVYGKDVTYSGGTYTLTNTMTTTGTWATDYNTLNNNHYTCFSTGTTCSSVYYVYFTSSSIARYITLTNGKKIEDALDEMLNESNINTTNSTVKTQVDNWYNTNLSSYTSYIEDTIYCNDRSISELNGWNPNGGDTTNSLYFSTYTRIEINISPSLACNRMIDRFTISSSIGNGALTYPIGLLTSDEVMYAGGKGSTGNSTYYLYTNQSYWVNSPTIFGNNGGSTHIVSSSGSIVSADISVSSGHRPVISLKPNTMVSSGDGTSTNPYVISTS